MSTTDALNVSVVKGILTSIFTDRYEYKANFDFYAGVESNTIHIHCIANDVY